MSEEITLQYLIDNKFIKIVDNGENIWYDENIVDGDTVQLLIMELFEK